MKKRGMMIVRKIIMKLINRVKNYFSPTIEDALGEFGVGGSTHISSEELRKLKKLLEEYEEETLIK